MKRISMTLGVAAAILVVAGSQTAWAENAAPPSKSAKWERKASEWAVETFGKALEKNKAKSEQNLKALNARPITPLPQEIVDAHKAQGFVIFNRPYGQQISRKASPKPEEVNVKAFSAALARDEWEPVQVGIWTLKKLSPLIIS